MSARGWRHYTPEPRSKARRSPWPEQVVTGRPHFVPRTYLRAWADSDDQVAYRRHGDRIEPEPVPPPRWRYVSPPVTGDGALAEQARTRALPGPPPRALTARRISR